MAVRSLLTLSTLVASAFSSSNPAQAPISDTSSSRGPSLHLAKENGIQVFNALHASMRQWDSSLKHNGMSFFAASIPNNTLLYHGTHTEKEIEGIEWLAFEIEHAEVFARTRGPGGGGPGGGGPGRGPPGERPGGGRGPPEDGEGRRGPPGENKRDAGPRKHMDGTTAEGDGYLHIYKTKKHLRLLYLDGMSAGKTSMGTLDTQDQIFLNKTSSPSMGSSPPRNGGPFGDYQRAEAMCSLGAEYGIEGIIRMEAGFELILCNFSTGVELLSANKRPNPGTNESINELGQFEYMRGVSLRYEGITANRVIVDYSSMVSAFFYPLNLTNPDSSRPELPRLPADDEEGLARLKADVLEIFKIGKAQKTPVIDWQGVVDMIVTRYSDRLQFIISNSSTQQTILSEINFLLSVFVNYEDSLPSIQASVDKCTSHYLLPVSPVTASDKLIYASIQAVTKHICNTLFSARSLLLADQTKDAADRVKNDIKDLTNYLDWSTWKTCGKCGYDEVCFVAIWPWGGVEDHFEPGCVKNEQLAGRRGYWDFRG